jgi:hypothetical protein
MTKPLEKAFDFYLKHQNELVKKYKGKYVVIKNDKVLGAFDTEFKAVEETSKRHALGTFLVQLCEPGEESYTHSYHSRVMFG